MGVLEQVRGLNRVWVRGNRAANTVNGLDHVRLSGLNRIEFDGTSIDNVVELGEGAWLQSLRIRFFGRRSKVILAPNCRWKGYILVYGNGRTVRIGERSTCIETYIVCRDRNVTIGSDCMFSRGIEIRSTDVHPIYDRATNERINPAADVVVGDHVWVAANTTLSKGSVIPDGCVVGAMSFVNRAFDAPNCVIAGSPARVVRDNIRWER